MAASSVNVSPGVSEREGEEALDRLKSANPLLYLSPSPELSRHARIASSYLFSALLPYCPKKPLLDRLLIGDEFDAEQIWSQIDEISRPIVSMLQREVKRLAREPPVAVPAEVKEKKGSKEAEDEEDEDEDVAIESEDEDGDDDESGEEEEEEEEAVAGANGGVEDQFLKIKELEEYLAKDEAKEYGQSGKKTRRKKDEKEGDEEEEEDDGEEDDDDLEFGSFDDEDKGEGDLGESARYEDFFVSNKKKQGGAKKEGSVKEKGSSKKVKFADELEDFADEMDDEEKDNGDASAQDGVLSTHEKEQRKIQSKIEQMEKESLEPKAWTMQGEVTAAKRPKNSALEVDLDFEHNMRPAPVITEEVTASIEDLIRKRIIEGKFDHVQRAPALPSQVPKERQELDENKSKKGLAEIYEEDYAKKAGLISVPLSSSDEQKKEATILFKNLCLKLDALAHFHFAPKPIIEDMSIQTNVPALAMEEIAPLAVSDAAMLAPEEIFEGKGDIKEETELTQAERKRRRANKKRRYKAGESKKAAKRARVNADQGHPYPRHGRKAD